MGGVLRGDPSSGVTMGDRHGAEELGEATVRFYLDADLLGLAKLLVQVRYDVTYPGDPGGVLQRRKRPPCPVMDPAAPDTEWIPEVAARGWLIVTQDSHLQDRRVQIAAVREHGARMVAFTGRHAGGTFDQLEAFITQWRRILAVVDEPGPFIYTATRRTFHPFPLA
jgi:hypothetical protein